jgi:mono/diheme cytochrome c family protein
VLALLVPVLQPSTSAAQDAAEYFRQNCASCHTIGGGRLTGPDLKDVTVRRDHAWLLRYIPDPKSMIDAGDPVATQLFQEARGVLMPSLPTATPQMVDALISLIEAESKLEKSQFVGVQVSDRPFTANDITVGRALVRGDRKLANAGPPCLSCHTVHGLGAFGGGRLGPDLTKVYERLQGRKALSVWLSAPATSTMQSVFRDTPLEAEEILPLVAYFEDAAKQGGEDTGVGLVTFLLCGLGAAVVGLVAFDGAWRRRFRAVRAPMVTEAGFGRKWERGGSR